MITQMIYILQIVLNLYRTTINKWSLIEFCLVPGL